MVKFKSIILITVIGLVILFSGCVGQQGVTPTPAPTVTTTSTVTATPIATATPTVTVATPKPTTPMGQLSGAIYVDARMKQPSIWGNGTYGLNSVQVQVSSLVNTPISIKAQIVSDGQILEEKSFTLQSVGSSYAFGNEKSHFINSTNVTLWMLAEGYQPSEYTLKINR
ncbi:MAG: hypothetical protein ABOK23_08165 [Candidatus Methanoperedens sp.]|nr:hypothetical protein [Candidatus Methanoperedens sp.]MCZ7396339.1 hypothetical protein [Candidatus Methanoperedens sp.]